MADPKIAPVNETVDYARPDDEMKPGVTWRSALVSYNADGDNPLGLLPAYKLYRNEAYAALARKFGLENLYILSAGWGLLSSNFLTPHYDITFTQSADAYKRRRKSDRYMDLNMLPQMSDEPLMFFGGKDYVPLFCELTAHHKGLRTIIYNSANPPTIPGYIFERYNTPTRTNWHYEAVRHYIRRD